MKKGMFFALAASSLLFSACSSDDAVVIAQRVRTRQYSRLYCM